VGWATGPADLIAAVRVVRQHLSYVSSGPFQWAVITGLELPDHYFEEFRSGLAAQRDLLTEGLAQLGFGVVGTQGTYFTTTDVRSLGFASGAQFCAWAPEHAGVVAIPHAALSDHPDADAYVRWAFCKHPETLTEGLRRLSGGLAHRG
jgi:N-succinyldiaminopimelate aminotransferase